MASEDELNARFHFVKRLRSDNIVFRAMTIILRDTKVRILFEFARSPAEHGPGGRKEAGWMRGQGGAVLPYVCRMYVSRLC